MQRKPAPQDGQILTFAQAFDEPDRAIFFGQHGKFKTLWGDDEDSVHNPVNICVSYNAGDHLLEVADWSTGDSNIGATMGGDRNIVVADKPFALAEDTDCHILGVLVYRVGEQPYQLEGSPLAKSVGGASRFSSFVSQTGAESEDPKPRQVADDTQREQYEVNRKTGHAAHGNYYVHVYRLNVNEGQAYPALGLEASGLEPKTDTVFAVPTYTANYCPHCGKAI